MAFAMHRSKTRASIGAILAAVLVAATLAVTGSPASAHTRLSPGASCSGTA
ncbi:hypothetical protein [Micromonospora rubida]